MVMQSAVCTAGCMVSVQDIRFGSYDPADTMPTSTTAEYTVDCREPVLLSIEIGSGRANAGIGDRRMQHELQRDSLGYNLFRDSSMTQVWGDGAGNSTQLGRIQGHTTGFIYGQIPAGQDVRVGHYSDSLRMTILP
jgi:spore coat protein U-like protein